MSKDPEAGVADQQEDTGQQDKEASILGDGEPAKTVAVDDLLSLHEVSDVSVVLPELS